MSDETRVPGGDAGRAGALDRVPGWGWAAIAVVVALLAFRLGLGLDADTAPVPGGAPVEGTKGSLAGYEVQTADGATTELAASGEPTVVMVSSVSCTFCEEAMGEFARQADGRPLPRLRIVTLEGADRGHPMLRRNRLDGVWHAGPVDGAGTTLLTFQFPGTPTFLLLDGDGRVTAAMPGYPGAERIRPWVEVMLGERDGI